MLTSISLAIGLLLVQQSGNAAAEDGAENGTGQRSYAQSAYKKIRANSLLAQGKPLIWYMEPKGTKEQAFARHVAEHIQHIARLDALADGALQQKQSTWLESIETYRRKEMEYYFRSMRAYRWQATSLEDHATHLAQERK